METSRNPKVLNHVIMQKLNPILEKIKLLLDKDSDTRNNFIKDSIEKEESNVNNVNELVESYNSNTKKIYDEIDKSNIKLSNMIVDNLVNPNVASGGGGGGGGTPVVETKFIKDKTLNAIGYKFVIDGVSMTLAGAVGKGLGIGLDPAFDSEFTFNTPDNDKFPSYYVNDIYFVNPSRSFVSTNNGLIDYYLADGKYFVRDISCGMNNNRVVTLNSIRTKDATKSGYIAGTDIGLSFSPNGERWVNVDKDFKNNVTCLSRTEKINDNQSLLFIGTSSGLYFVDVDEYLKDNISKVYYLKSITKTIPSNYINAVAYNTAKDILYIATDGGLSVISDISTHISSGKYSEDVLCDTCITYTARSGLSSSFCIDVFLNTDSTVVIGTSDGLTLTKDFANFKYIVKKQKPSDQGLEDHMCNRIIRKSNTSVTIIHTIGLTEGIVPTM